MLVNPFTPTQIVSREHDFFGRARELETLDRALGQGSVAIQGPMGMGKSSLLARALLLMQGWKPPHAVHSTVLVANRDLTNVDEAARLLLEELVEIEEKASSFTFKLAPFLSVNSHRVRRHFVEGRHLAALNRLVTDEMLGSHLADRALLIFAVDEADKCPSVLGRLMRAVMTHSQQAGFERLRFLLAGVSPYLKELVEEDPGIGRFFSRTINLESLPRADARELLLSKLNFVRRHAEGEGIEIDIEASVIERVLNMAGGHPHLLQLLGSFLVESENAAPDGVIDESDLVGALREICYRERSWIYEQTLHLLAVNNKLKTLETLLDKAAPGFPTRIERSEAMRSVDAGELQWLIERNILFQRGESYGLVDEFLRVRLFEQTGREAPF